MSNAPLAVNAKGLTRHFDHGRVKAVDGLDLEIAAGEFVAIKGPSGCGKSTLLNLLTAIDRPDGGSLHGRTINNGDGCIRIALNDGGCRPPKSEHQHRRGRQGRCPR